jgi:cytochrome c oxidase assembly factor CtaG
MINIRKLVLLSAVLCWSSVVGADAPTRAWSYTMQEMYEMATYFKQIRTGKELDDTTKYVKAAEFKGYVAAILDSTSNTNQILIACAKKYPVNDIAMRTAITLTSNPLDRTQMSAIAINVAVRFACDDSFWVKEK